MNLNEKKLDEISYKFNKVGGTNLYCDGNNLKNLIFIVAGKTHDEAKKKLEEKINKSFNKNKEKYKKFKESKLVEINIIINKDKFDEKKKPSFKLFEKLVHPLHIEASTCTINRFNYLQVTSKDCYARFCYKDHEINQFSLKHLKKIIKIVVNNLIHPNPFKIYDISDIDLILQTLKST